MPVETGHPIATQSSVPTATGVYAPTATGDASATASGVPASTIQTPKPSETATGTGMVPVVPGSTSSGVPMGTAETTSPSAPATMTGGLSASVTAAGSESMASEMPATTVSTSSDIGAPVPVLSTPVSSSTGEAPAVAPSTASTIPEYTLLPTAATPPPQTILPTGTDSLTAQPIPTSIIVQPAPTSSSPTSADTGIPSSMPRIIQPPGGIPPVPKNTTLVQIGFDYGLNYPFVSSTQASAQQIFNFLPQGVAYGLGLTANDVVMHALEPYDTTQDLGYITTLALFYVPSDLIDQLSVDLHTPVSALYDNSNPPVRTLMSMVNPSFPLIAGQRFDGSGASAANDPAATTSAAVDAGAPLGGDSAMSSPVKTTSVGIGLGAAAGAVLYGAAMVLVARRYKQKRSRHSRASSVPSTGRGTGGVASGAMAEAAWMSGARGPGRLTPGGWDSRGSRNSGSSNDRSVRTQQISAPVMSENSLGWN